MADRGHHLRPRPDHTTAHRRPYRRTDPRRRARPLTETGHSALDSPSWRGAGHYSRSTRRACDGLRARAEELSTLPRQGSLHAMSTAIRVGVAVGSHLPF